jgi:hypothetical protein
MLLTLPTHLWQHVLTFYGYKDYTLAGRLCWYLHALWNEAVKRGKLPLFVPVDCKTLREAVERVHGDKRLTTIVLGKGEHQIGGYLEIWSTMNIVGNPQVQKEKIVILGGIEFRSGNSRLQHLTVCAENNSGVCGFSSFTMEDVLVEWCGNSGVVADNPGIVGQCTNVEVRQCGTSGVVAGTGAKITLIGPKTKVHGNCTKGGSHDYGLKVHTFISSTIQLVSPLTKEEVSFNNGGGGNWGAYLGAKVNLIKTIAAVVVTYNQCVYKLRF